MPKALDTNIVVRFLIDDGSKEVPIARAVFRRETVEIPLTVIVECEWVLRAVYKIGRVDICDAFEALLSLPSVIVHDDQIVAGAIDAHRLGVDFADAVHLLSIKKSDELLTLDDNFEKRAKRMTEGLPVRMPTLTA